MEIAGGVLGWSDQQFWSSSIQYFLASVRGAQEFHGGKKEEPIAREQYDQVREDYRAELSMTTDDLKRLREKQKQAKASTSKP